MEVMRLRHIYLHGYRTVQEVGFRAAPLTVLFGKNNAGKTNVLEAVHLSLGGDERAVRSSHADRTNQPFGYFEFEQGQNSSIKTGMAVPSNNGEEIAQRRVTFCSGGYFNGSIGQLGMDSLLGGPAFLSEYSIVRAESAPLESIYLCWSVDSLHEVLVQGMTSLVGESWLASNVESGESSYAINPRYVKTLSRLVNLANSILPDFVGGEVSAHVTSADLWDRMPKISIDYMQRGLNQCPDSIELAGKGAARWISIAIQIAFELFASGFSEESISNIDKRMSRGRFVLLDEPEANLHPGAVLSISRWIDRMCELGFNVIVATHHDQFLRGRKSDWELVSVIRSIDLIRSDLRNVEVRTVGELRRLAEEVGVPPASILALHRGILFVEGPLDVAVLEEYGALELEAAGVKVIPIHGTKNLEGIVTGEVVAELKIPMAVLTDATDVGSMDQRSNKKRSSEEKKIIRLLDLADRKSIVKPKIFGVVEDDLLFTIPVASLREVYLDGGEFPEWPDLIKECRSEAGVDSSVSVNWKEYAKRIYGVPLDSEAGVRGVVRAIDLAGEEISSVRKVIDEIVEWAMSQDKLAD